MPRARRMPSSSHTSSARCSLCRSCWKPLCVSVHRRVRLVMIAVDQQLTSIWHRSADVVLPRQLLCALHGSSRDARRTPGSVLCYRGDDRGYHHVSIRRLPDCCPSHDVLRCVDFIQLHLHRLCFCQGERRIRVVTTALPTTNNLSEVFASADQIALATLLANKAVERSITHKLEDARDALFGKMVEILQAYKASMTAAGAGASAQLAIAENLKLLPVLVLGLLKNVSSLHNRLLFLAS